MAAYAEHKLQREDMLACSVCFERYVDTCIPKNLECGHICCQTCLQQMLLGSGKKGYVKCPECRRVFRIPGGKIKNLSTNFTLKGLAEHEQNRPKSSTPLVRHTTMRRRVTKLKEQESVVLRQEKVDTGEEEELETLRLKIECLEQQLQHQDFPNESIYMSVVDAPQEISIPAFHSPLASPPLLKPSAPPLVLNMPPPLPLSPPLLSPNTERQRMSLPDIPRTVTPEFVRTLPSHQAMLSPPTTHSTDQRRSLPGNTSTLPSALQQHQVPEHLAASPMVTKKHLQPVEEFGNFEQAQGIAITPDGLFAVCDFKGELVTVFQRKKTKYLKKFNLALYAKNPNRPADVAATIKGEFLVARRTGVELYSPKGKYQRTLPNASQDTLGVCTVDTSTDGRIFAGDISHYAIIIYNAKGDTIFNTFSTDTKPARIATLGNQYLAVSHARFGRLEVLDIASGTSINLMDIPEVVGIRYDPNTECILVVRNKRIEPGRVESNTGVIEQYNVTTGELIAVLAEELYHPFHLAFTSRGLLAVADKKTIKLFQVREEIYQ